MQEGHYQAKWHISHHLHALQELFSIQNHLICCCRTISRRFYLCYTKQILNHLGSKIHFSPDFLFIYFILMTFKDSKFFKSLLSLHEDWYCSIKRCSSKGITLMTELNRPYWFVMTCWNCLLYHEKVTWRYHPWSLLFLQSFIFLAWPAVARSYACGCLFGDIFTNL